MRWSTRAAFVAAVVVVSSPAVARADDVAGDWVHSMENGEAKLGLRSDGTFEFMGMTGKWKSDAAHLTLSAATGENVTYEAKLAGDELTLTGGDLGDGTLVFTRKSGNAAAKPQAAKPEEKKTDDKKPDDKTPDTAEGDKPVELSRKPQATVKDAKKLTPRFSGKTRVAKTETFEVTLPESWTFQPGEKDGVQFLVVNPGLQPTDVMRQQIIFWVKPVPLAEIEAGFKDRVEKGAAGADQIFNGNGLSMARKSLAILDAPSGLMARLDYAGTLTNQFVQGQSATGLAAVVQRKMYDVAVTIVTLEGNTKDATDDALAVLDSTKCFLKDRDADLEKKIVGQWVVPSKTGNTLEYYTFAADGTYKWHYEGSYSGSIKDSGGNETASWGTASQNDEAGRYEIRGDLIFFVSNRGEQGLHVQQGTRDGKVALTIGRKTFVR